MAILLIDTNTFEAVNELIVNPKFPMLEEFKNNHQEFFDMTYGEVNEISLEEVKSNTIKIEEKEYTPRKSIKDSSIKTDVF